ncbi:tRNA (guanosine(46)-N7)-methyltransferase TrmB [Calidifontibacter sp. DB0510]|uniref:tRNA (guanine-N(7)-)-methyltransferase n=1 Tax=Metallococcus carri TaxID=1656884 RepID=A0A967AWG0_9MICO|nr:tRNA (guanosine(46)-N7)-methyltransferase TrmB [Metallococcus carri]NHN54209.1 tRNA (guanosine(46)-N7)-methyltransferase TrmB [Metallococcus carri]NOP36951.1 tRNA (guanosine(46)-N7)-methyltransferase TrmB [Calidifontibacter sp. DB2511S]
MPARHHRALDVHGPAYLLDLPFDGPGTTIDPAYRLDQEREFGRVAPLIVEIGSGSGDCVVHAAGSLPEVDFLAFEVWRPGAAQTIAKAVHDGVGNLRIAVADAAQALSMITPGTVQEVWTFFPDPWPKAKHHKRRLVTPEFAERVASILAPGGVWRLATDWADYAWVMRDVVSGCPSFTNPYAGRAADPVDAQEDPRGWYGGFAPRFELRPMTRFEAKGLRAGRVVRDLAVTRSN